jgi:sugar phosphate isomerase/epimerase
MLMGKRPHLSPLDVSDETLASLRVALTQNGVKCAVIAAYTDLSGAGAAEVPYLEMQIAYVQALARVARQLDADIIRVFTAYEVDGQSPQAVWDRVVRALREICDRAAAENVTIAVQNHHDIAVHSDALLELLGDVGRPNCKLGFDAWSPALRSENLYETARQLAPHTAITTNADYVRLPRFRYRPEVVNYERAQPDLVRAVRFGEGCIDYRAFFQGLRDGGFNGWANYEMCSPIRGGGAAENLDACASHYVRWMRDHVLKA